MRTELRFALALRMIGRFGLLSIGIIVFVFALLSGSEAYGGGLHGIIQNSPNALPWLALLALVFISWKKEMAGGIVVSLFGMVLIVFFNFMGPNFFPSTFIMTSMVFLLGLCLVGSAFLNKKYGRRLR